MQPLNRNLVPPRVTAAERMEQALASGNRKPVDWINLPLAELVDFWSLSCDIDIVVSPKIDMDRLYHQLSAGK